jgi:hypothetical protein
LERKIFDDLQGSKIWRKVDIQYDMAIITAENCQAKVGTLKTELNKVQIERRKDGW